VKPAKDEGKGNAASPEPGHTAFERFTNFTRRILAVPKSEIQAQERLYQKRRIKKRGKHK
jgi:hypothetical protein